MGIGIDDDRHAKALGVLAKSPIEVESIRARIEFHSLQPPFVVVFGHVLQDGEKVDFVAFATLKNSTGWVAQHGRSWMIDGPYELLGVVHFVPASPLRHGVHARHHVIELRQNIVWMVEFAAGQDIGFHARKELEVNAILLPLGIVFSNGGHLLEQVFGAGTVGDLE